jgi:hypothetical protein
MTKKHFEAMAEIVNNIRTEKWSSALDDKWARDYIKSAEDEETATRACEVAEAFIVLGINANPRFDRERFLRACGLIA